MSTLLPSSSVNTMSSDDDKCFQCQEMGTHGMLLPLHKMFSTAMIMAMLQQIAQTKFCHQAYQQDTEITTLTQEDMIDPHLEITIAIGIITVTIKTGTGLAGPDPIPITPDLGVTVTVTLKEVTLDPITNPHAAAHHATEAQAHIVTDETPHTADPHHAGVSPETTVDLDHIHHANTTTKHQQDLLPALIEQPGKPKAGNTSRSPLMTHHPSTIAPMNKPATQKMI